ncbi:hypothetical protein EBQ26_11050 [Allofranklinella schreckenbergeri]|nr:hypothetical protein EBQ26_11050 [Allofranklinella schreckenbergeri]
MAGGSKPMQQPLLGAPPPDKDRPLACHAPAAGGNHAPRMPASVGWMMFFFPSTFGPAGSCPAGCGTFLFLTHD